VFNRLGVIAYRDYSDPIVIEQSGWDHPDLLSFIERLTPLGGGDYPEAAKTALLEALLAADDAPNTETLVMWYADAPPHHASIRSSGNAELEKQAFRARDTHRWKGPHMRSPWDWVNLVECAVQQRLTVVSFTPNLSPEDTSFYVYLAQMTGGLHICQSPAARTAPSISRLTMDVILSWMGQPTSGSSITDGVTTRRFEVSPLEAEQKPINENDGSRGYLPTPSPQSESNPAGQPTLRQKVVNFRFRSGHVPMGRLSSNITKTSLAQRFADPSQGPYREQVYASLASIVSSNVAALTRNPVFGQLWRAVCRDQPSAQQEGLLNLFSSRVSKMEDEEERMVMRRWLDDSFDASEEIASMISKVPASGPAIILDLDVRVELTRTELLEVSRSCYSGVLKKVVEVFTHIKVRPSIMKSAPRDISL
jgi:hypothetical protein